MHYEADNYRGQRLRHQTGRGPMRLQDTRRPIHAGGETPPRVPPTGSGSTLGSSTPAASPAPENSPADDTVSLIGKRALIVEDEGLTRMQLRRILTAYGVDVAAVAANGAEGVRIALEQRPDLILMDINMPVLDGLSATEQIRAQMETCVVMLTALDQDDVRNRAQTAGASGFLPKPVDSLTLMNQLEAIYMRYRDVSRGDR